MPTLKHLFQLLGMYGVGISLLLGALLCRVAPKAANTWMDRLYVALTYAAFVFSAGCSMAYLTYPNFIDHLEPTLLQITQIWIQGGEIYPAIDAPSMHGLLYGPALYWIQRPFVVLSTDPIWGSKLPGIVVFNLAWLLLFTHLKHSLSRAYLLFLLPFNLILFWNRAEPFFVLFAAVAIGLMLRPSTRTPFWLGLLAGLASSLKAHGLLYVLPLLLFCPPLSVRRVASFALGLSLVSLSFFLDAGTSLTQYVAYLKLAAQHGISWAYLEKNLFFLACLWLPLVLTFRRQPLLRDEVFQWAGVLAIEVVISIAGAKPGAGVHHLIPIVAINAYLFDRRLATLNSPYDHFSSLKFGFAILAFYILGFAWKNVYDSEIKDATTVQSQREATAEIRNFAAAYPSLWMGVTDKDNANYRLTFLRPYLVQPDAPQFEYAGFMDLNYAGVSAAFLADEFTTCKHPYIALPQAGEPFSILNFYNNQPLFPETVRRSFAGHYSPIAQGQHFTVYQCKKDRRHD